MGSSVSTAANGFIAPESELRRYRLELDRLQLQMRELQQENESLKEVHQRRHQTLSSFAPAGNLLRTLAADDVDTIVAAAVREGGRSGGGKFGSVLKGHVRDIAEPLALKLAASCDGSGRAEVSSGWHERFMRELQVQAVVRSEHLVPLLAICPARLAVAFPWAEHGSLQDKLVQSPVSPGEGLHFLLGAAKGLQALHRHSLVHGDVRSACILLFGSPGSAGEIVAQLSSCGCASEDGPSAAHVSEVAPKRRPYLDPFRMLGCRLARACDVFSLGVVLLEVLLGRTAVQDPTASEDVTGISHTRRPRPQLLWQVFLNRMVSSGQAPSRGSDVGDAGRVAADAIRAMLPVAEWHEEPRQSAAALAEEMLETRVGNDDDESSEWTMLQAVAPVASEQKPPHRPSVQQVVERLELSLTLHEGAVAATSTHERLCIVCLDGEVGARLLPCNHAALCEDCASLIVGRKEKCPICRQPVGSYDRGDFLRTFAP